MTLEEQRKKYGIPSGGFSRPDTVKSVDPNIQRAAEYRARMKMAQQQVEQEKPLNPLQRAMSGDSPFKDIPIIGPIGQGISDFVEGGLKSIPSAAGGIASLIRQGKDYITGEKSKKSGFEELATKLGETDTVAGGVGKAIGTGLMTAPLGPAAIGRTAGSVATFLGRSLASTAAYSAAEGKVPTGKDITFGAAVDLFLPGIGKLTEKAGNIVSGFSVPKTPTEFKLDEARRIDVGKVLNEKVGPSLTRGKLLKKTEKVMSEVGAGIDQMVNRMNSSVKPVKATDFTDELTGIVQEATGGDIFAGLGRKEVQRVKNKIMDKAYGFLDSVPEVMDLNWVQKAKKELGGSLPLTFWQKLFLSPNKVKLIEAGNSATNAIRKQLQTMVEDNVPGAKEANHVYSSLKAIQRGLEKKSSRLDDALGVLSGLGFAGSGGGGIEDLKNDPLGFITNTIIGYAVFKGLVRSTGAKTGAGYGMYKTGKGLQSPTLKQSTKGLLIEDGEPNTEENE